MTLQAYLWARRLCVCATLGTALAATAGCSGGDGPSDAATDAATDVRGDAPPVGPTRARVLPTRTQLFDRPYPSDELRTPQGTIDVSTLPLAGSDVGQSLLRGWTAQVRAVAHGFPAVTPVYFRFTGPVTVAAHYEGAATDAIRVYALDSTDVVPVNVRFIADSHGDPYVPAYTLVVTPDERHPLRPGGRYAAVVSQSVALPAEGWQPPPEVTAGNVAVATVFTVDDAPRELRALRDAADAVVERDPTVLTPPAGLRRANALRYEQGRTPTDHLATVETVTFVDGTTQVTYLGPAAGVPAGTVDLTAAPYDVYEVTIKTVGFQSREGRPWQTAGNAAASDAARTDGWLHFDATGHLQDAAYTEPWRVVVQVPRSGAMHPVVLWSHGADGDAYEAVQRVNPEDRGGAIRAALASSGAVVVSADLPLLGQRVPLVAQGFAPTRTYASVGNLVAARDTARQAAIEHRLLYRFAVDALPRLLGAGVVDATRVGAFGYAEGARVAALAAVLHPTASHPSAYMLASAGGFLAHYVVAGDSLRLGSDVGDELLAAARVPAPAAPATPAAVLAALFGVPVAAASGIDRYHPLLIPYQLLADSADPLTLASSQPQPATVVMGVNDRFAPNDSSHWLEGALPQGTLVECQPTGAYDGHYCALREAAMLQVYTRFVDALAP